MKKSALLFENETHKLYMECGCDYNYIVFLKTGRGFVQEVGRAWRLTNGVTRFFTKSEIEQVKAKRHEARNSVRLMCA